MFRKLETVDHIALSADGNVYKQTSQALDWWQRCQNPWCLGKLIESPLEHMEQAALGREPLDAGSFAAFVIGSSGSSFAVSLLWIEVEPAWRPVASSQQSHTWVHETCFCLGLGVRAQVPRLALRVSLSSRHASMADATKKDWRPARLRKFV